ncbi:RNA polymerase II elongation factor Ell-like [Belonocnema kinseyi]|uniref:RNA polymerase II elongation factor Ell-like n=1 Tax=Belonocnema kinseyi TaxID=2817044 RepID=UPI00143DE38B|nr:RNA polymerase II elongation factor Ell-like [Belonocnema kinseyi]
MIKAKGLNIWRKVNVQESGRSIPPPLPANIRHCESTNISTSGAGSSRFSSSTSSSYKKNACISPPVGNKPKKQLSDIARTPIRERLIHLLALRPYKKPDIYERIYREGCREKDRSKISEHLTEIAFKRDHFYLLKKSVWNNVQDNWIYYTEEEKSLLKKRKPQNLTLPGFSDGSSGSRPPSNSIHPGSPPSITAPPRALLKSKRPAYNEGNGNLPTKKPRISQSRDPEALFVNHGENGSTAGSSVDSGDSRFSCAERVSGCVNSLEVISGSNSGTCNSRSSLFTRQKSNWNQRQPGGLNSAEGTTNKEMIRGSSYPAASLCLEVIEKMTKTSSRNNASSQF